MPGTDQLFNRTLNAMRGVWRGGPSSRDDLRIAVSALEELSPRAGVSNDVAELLAHTIRQLERLPPGASERKPILERIATDLKAIQPSLGVTTQSSEIGKLNSSLGERRAGRKPPTRQAPSTEPRVLPPDANVSQLKGVATEVSKKLAIKNIHTIEELLRFAPRKHIDYSRRVDIGSPFGLQGDVTIGGTIVEANAEFARKPPRFVIRLADATGSIRIVWYNTYLSRQLKEGDQIVISGSVRGGYSGPEIMSPEWERNDGKGLSTGRLIPVYASTQGLAQKSWRNLTRQALDVTRTTITDWLPDAREFIDPDLNADLSPLGATYEQLHYPDDIEQFHAARRRLMFADLVLLQLGLIKRKNDRQAMNGRAMNVDGATLHAFRRVIPFTLTGAQDRALDELLADVRKSQPMARLLQGDVGSGKTVVAAALALVARSNGRQTAIMAPTELLAEQHLSSMTALFASLPDELRPTVAMLSGSTRAKARREIRDTLASGMIDILVGTHALIQEDVTFKDVGLVVIDEQHRFGVRQRQQLADKSHGRVPHVLSMTATPIPRTLNFVLAGDLDVSIINERPPGRIPIETRRFSPSERKDAYDLVRSEVLRGHQAFVICPLVEDSETLDVKSAIEEFERLQRDIFPDLAVGLVHGRMAARKKDEVMVAFRNHEFDILVSTSVIEVGIDIPNATVMMIEAADRFGLSQLHQFRGRVGRGGAKSFCLLLTDATSNDINLRLDTMVATDDGFVLAERDLELRGPGDFIGTRQSGLPELEWLQDGFDTRLLDAARVTAERIVDADPEISLARFPKLKPRLQLFWSTARPVELTRS